MRARLKQIKLLSIATFFIIRCTSLVPEVSENHHPGDHQVSDFDGMVLLYVPEGAFTMGSADPDAPADELPQHSVMLRPYWIDQTEVTNAQYERCVFASVCAPLVTPRADIDFLPDHPVQGVSWPNAEQYCAWVERRLPTEAEWEKAARGVDGRLYPWGDQSPNESKANYNDFYNDVTAVGSFPAGKSPFGALDMAGNVNEWVSDWYDEGYYLISPYNTPAGPEGSLQKVIRGGDFLGQSAAIRTTNRYWAYAYRNDFDGFRCAMDAAK